MKNLQLLFVLFACTCLMACSNYELPDNELESSELKNASIGVVITVVPSGGDDTEALDQAFAEAKAAGPGSIVQLCEGEFHLGFIEIRDFHGTLKGAGKGKTIITAMNNLDLGTKISLGIYPVLMKFVGGDVTICHFTIRTPPGKVSVGGPGYGHISALVGFSASSAIYEPLNENRSVNVVVDNVCFRGQKLDEGGIGYVFGYNLYFALMVCPDYLGGPANTIPRQKSDVTVTNSEFDTSCYGIVIQSIKNSRVVIGEKNLGNIFSNLDQAGGVWEGRNNKVVLEGNIIHIPPYSYGFDLDDYPYYPYLKDEAPEQPMFFDIGNNVFNLDHSEYALLLRNRRTYTNPGDIPVVFQISNNQFNMTDGYEWAIASLFTHRMVIRNNKFTGHGDLALYLANYSKNGLVLGNNFSRAIFETAGAYLAPNTQNWTFVGGNFTDKVIDLGVNNVFTGINVSTADEPLGRSISEKIVPMNHLMK